MFESIRSSGLFRNFEEFPMLDEGSREYFEMLLCFVFETTEKGSELQILRRNIQNLTEK